MADADASLFYASRCHAAAAGGKGLIVAIERGAAIDDDTPLVTATCDALASKQPPCTFFSSELDALIPKEVDGAGFPAVLTEGRLDMEDEEAWSTSPDMWALRMGYARDRVIAYAQIKAALMARKNLTTSPELEGELARLWSKVQAQLRETEIGIASMPTKSREKPADIHSAWRSEWVRASAELEGAHKQQPTLRRTPLVTGLTATELTAMIADPLLKRDETLEASAGTLERMAERDAAIGTETFVSFVFPDASHEWLQAAAATGSGLATERGVAFPAYVTMHNPTGVINSYAQPPCGGKCPNSFIAPDAAALLSKIHSLCEGKREFLLLEHGLF